VRRLIVFVIFMLLAVLAPGPAWVRNLRAQDPPATQARKAAEQWLALVDAGKYGESWDEGARMLKDTVSRKDWISTVKEKRGPLGKVVSRKLSKADSLKNIPGLPPGEYFGLQFKSSFAKLPAATEVVVPTLEKDGKWRVSEYVVQKTP
jgi:Protein of unknown function (DUF4019)